MKLSPIRRLAVPTTPSTGETMGRGFDFALVMLVFLGIGALIDHWLGTWPGVAIGLVIFSVVGQFVSMYYRYKADMEAHEAERRERQVNPARRSAAAGRTTDTSGTTSNGTSSGGATA